MPDASESLITDVMTGMMSSRQSLNMGEGSGSSEHVFMGYEAMSLRTKSSDTGEKDDR